MSCEFPGCGWPCRGSSAFCASHHKMAWRGEVLRPIQRRGGPCSYPGCERARHAEELCTPHYHQLTRRGWLSPVGWRSPFTRCAFPTCDRPVKGDGLCESHRNQARRGGELRPIKVYGQANPKEGRPAIPRAVVRAVLAATTCALCGGEVDHGLDWPHPASASIDHVTEWHISRSHALDNLQLAHLGCNLAKEQARRRTI